MPAAAAVATIVAAKMASNANNHAADTQAKGASDALSFSKDNETERRREWDYQQAQAKAAWDARQKMLAPFLAGGASVLAKYGIKAPPDAAPPSAPMPSGYQGGPAPMTPSAPGPASMPPPPGVGASSAGMAPAALSTGTLGSMMAPAQPAPFDWNAWRGLPNA